MRLKIVEISQPQMDRLLRPHRLELEPQKGLSGTKAVLRRIKNQIPIQAKDWNVTEPGQQMQADTVSHCGNSLLGQFINSLTLTDIYSAWTENRALW